eukprot:TRINITY_DN1317_c0_g1_i4.p1 TRINITY_DN1317_c0_g1~~TRINITY_DN1317_c0_g1_i4.p1  ORF type:complete len:105 (+),score=24.36 TRINITY_DN1317_c0_g1_i4:92-406(+)
MAPHPITSKDEFAKKVGQPGKLVVAEFHAKWCGNCAALAPVFNDLSAKYPNVEFITVDVDDVKVPDAEGIAGVPHFKYYKNGSLIKAVTGTDQGKIEKHITSNQ